MESVMVKVYPLRYDMRVMERKVFMYYMVESSVHNFQVMVDVRQKMVNLSDLVRNNIITSDIKNQLQSKAKKFQISSWKRNVFISIAFLLKYITQKKYINWIIKAVSYVALDVQNRTKFLSLEKQKRNKEFQKQFNIQISDRQQNVQYLKSKIKYLFQKDYDINPEESLDKLYDRVKSNSILSTELRMSHIEEQKMNSIFKRYSRQFDKIAKFKGSSIPTKFRLRKQLTSLYIVYTDLEATFEGTTYNVVKVGKTDNSIYDYESCLYRDYKSKILFKHVFLGVFEKKINAGDIDKFFHQRLFVIPKSKYFIFNFNLTEQDIRVSQQFYLLTNEFIEKMDQLLKQFCSVEKHVENPIFFK